MHDAFTLGRVKTLYVDFTKSNVFIILGSNGSGKSSLLQSLLTWPDDSSRYKPGGYKTVKILNDGKTYVLTCQYNGQDKYIMTCNEEVLYKGSHGQMFSSVVEQHLGFTKLYKSLLLENAQVTKMNSSQRSQWLMDLSGIDYTWALALYDKLKAKRNMFSGSAKVNAQRLAQMSKETVSESDECLLKEKQSKLMNAVSYMHSVRVPSQSNINDAIEELKEHEKSFKTLLRAINSKRYTNAQVDCAESIQSVLDLLKCIVIKLRSHINNKYELAQECKSIIGENTNDSVESLSENIIKTENEIEKISKSLTITKVEDTSISTKALVDYNKLYTWFNSFNKDWCSAGGIYSKNDLEQALKAFNKAQSRQSELTAALERISGRLEHYESHLSNGSVECPNCKHSFISGYNRLDHESSKEKLIKVKSMLSDHKLALEQSIKAKIECEHKKDLWYIWSKFVNDYSYMAMWLNKIMNEHVDTKIELGSLWDRLGFEIQTLTQLKELQEQLFISKNKLELIKHKNQADVLQAQTKLDQINKDLSTLSSSMQRVTDVIYKYEKKLLDIKSFNVIKNSLVSSFEKTNVLISNVDEVYRQHYFNHALQNMQSDLADVQSQLRKIDQSSAMIEGVKQNLEQDKFLSQCWAALAKAMSPKDGIIGKSLIAFLSDFFNDVNDFIEQVWTYELSVVPIEVDENGELDMDYNFKLIQDSKILKDISHGSEAMKYIVDLAFRLTALLRIKTGGVAMLDEPFTSLDQSHRSQATFAMKRLIESDLFEQLFIISHHSEFHEAFSSASVICLDPRNISVPSTANACVKIEHY
jgi:DNA repair exonuclease SbcCD ATPase subunit